MTQTQTALDAERYFELLDSDTERLIGLGGADLEVAVPSCPGWQLGDLLAHVAQVYAHKARVLADYAWPDPWPPADFEGQPVALLRDAKDDLFAELSRHSLDEPAKTFGPDKTVGFWVRRMALEAVVHRFDAELALDVVSEVPEDLALDGIDELLCLFLGGPWWSERVQTAHPVSALVAIESGQRRWLCDVQEKSVEIATTPASADAAVPAATVTGAPAEVFLWLWGRLGDDAVEVTGDPLVATELRARVVECTA